MNKKIINHIVDYNKLLYIPFFISLLTIVILVIAINISSKEFLINKMKKSSIAITSQITNQFENNDKSLKLINSMLNSKFESTGNIVIENKDNLSNEYLKNLATQLNVNEIHWLNSSADILYSTNSNYIGFTLPDSHPLNTFINSNLLKSFEIERFTNSDNPNIKYAAFKSIDGNIAYISIDVSTINEIASYFSYQSILDSLKEEISIKYALLTDTNAVTIADFNINHTDMNYSSDPVILDALAGNTSSAEIFDEISNSRVFDFAVPVYNDNSLIGALNVGFSLEPLYNQIKKNAIISIVISIIMFLLFWTIQFKNIIKPVLILEKNMSEIDLNSNRGYLLPFIDTNTFKGLTFFINTLLEKIYASLNYMEQKQIELNSSNAELKVAYNQLSASESALRINYNDIQAHKDKIEYLAYNDSLTGLPNRAQFTKIMNSIDFKSEKGAIMLLDLDNFKQINDTMGHLYGDKVLEKISDTFKKIANENSFIFRFGGDEFLIYIKDEQDTDVISEYAKDIAARLNKDLIINNHTFNLSFSIGITLFPKDTTNIDELLINADTAMYKVKNQGKSNYMFFDISMLQEFSEKIEIEKELKQALEHDEFSLVFQPQISSVTGMIASFEALLRLKDNKIPPYKFIPVAEESGLIIQIGRWVLEETLRQMCYWREQGLDLRPVAVNFSSIQLSDHLFHDFLKEKLDFYNISPKLIKIEITESIFLENTNATISFLNKFKNMGVGMALDDFGTGYSSISYLTYIPVEKVKLDKSLSDRFLELNNIQVMRSIIDLVHNLNLDITAEGIESIEQFEKLRNIGCDYIQGYLFSKPISSQEIVILYNKSFF